MPAHGGPDGTSPRETPRTAPRRRVVAAGLGALVAGLAGCSGSGGAAGRGRETPTITPAPLPTDPGGVALVAVDHPDAVAIGAPVEYAFTIENTAAVERRFATTVRSVGTPAAWRWTQRVSARVGPGRRATFALVEPSFQFLGRRDVRLDALGVRFAIRSRPRRFRFGAWAGVPVRLVYPDRLEVRRLDVRVAAPVDGGPTASADPTRWLVLPVAVRHGDEVGPIPAPSPDDVHLRAAGRRYEASDAPESDLPAWVTGERYVGGRVRPGAAVDGWVPFEVPARLPVDAFAARWERSYEAGTVAVEWTGDARAVRPGLGDAPARRPT